MPSSVALYEALTSAPDERARARVIAEAFERLEERYPHLPDLATQAHLRETELRLHKEIEQIRADLKADIEQGDRPGQGRSTQVAGAPHVRPGRRHRRPGEAALSARPTPKRRSQFTSYPIEPTPLDLLVVPA